MALWRQAQRNGEEAEDENWQLSATERLMWRAPEKREYRPALVFIKFLIRCDWGKELPTASALMLIFFLAQPKCLIR